MGFQVQGAAAVVTGAGSGIGAGIAQRLLEAGASVVLGDLDAERLAATAAELDAAHPGRVAHVAGDAADEGHVHDLIAAAPAPVDLYVANAGIFRGFGLDADDAAWESSWQVNVQSHVRAARALVPGWVERAAAGAGGGVFVSTASAAGLLTQLGSPTYATTKHAAVGFAEWLAATYGDRGVQVCCLCPMGVRTDMLSEGATSADGDAGLGMRAVTTAGRVLSPLEVADTLLDAVAAGRFLALPHPEVGDMLARKAADHDHWISGMQRFRGSLEP
ncbi:oxidoreductase, short chain dehydrogenase/reductase family protein [Aeromicrobium marinum DSM 15272]|uniref:Oxidoreductase, short chain dehydrogenase/reductase family protein n=1 Tax=Aeromicrobium marinum DSM 15272 TaxID=585531 RepID=E2SF73_9ACTN|nr:SDR family oxidoreductase [Aeromicrobium marinum]EFQ82158.1 oxidoreductase, short chain dehydrogenase/reductase family protein [Aeromicrobium marinum DSM 15272]